MIYTFIDVAENNVSRGRKEAKNLKNTAFGCAFWC